MGLRVNNNIAALNAYRNLSVTDGQMSKSLEKLSSGFRINRAADDAAGLAISEGLRSQIGGLKVAVRNTQDGISVVQTAEGALTETHSILQRMRDLSVQASQRRRPERPTPRATSSPRSCQLKAELDRIANTTTFNGKKLLDGSSTPTSRWAPTPARPSRSAIGTAMGVLGPGCRRRRRHRRGRLRVGSGAGTRPATVAWRPPRPTTPAPGDRAPTPATSRTPPPALPATRRSPARSASVARRSTWARWTTERGHRPRCHAHGPRRR